MVENIDLIIGGSPCQSFSNAGNRLGMEGKSGLFYEFVRLLKEIQPKYFLLENVKMKQPILIDLLTGKTYELKNISYENGKMVISNIPLQDYPFLIMEKQNVNYK